MSLIYRDYKYLDYSKRKYFKIDNHPLQSIKPHELKKQNSGFPFNSKTLRSEIFADYDVPGPGSYDSTSNSIERKKIKHPKKLYKSIEPRIHHREINDNVIGPGQYELLSNERRSRMKRRNQIKLINSKSFTNIFYQNHKLYHKLIKPTQLSLIIAGDNIKDKDSISYIPPKKEIRNTKKKHNLYHTYADEIKEKKNQSCSKIKTNPEVTFDNNNDSHNNNEKSNNLKSSQVVEIKIKDTENEKVSTISLCNQLFKIKPFLNSTHINEKKNADFLSRKLNEDNELSRVGPGSYNTKSQFDGKRKPIILQNFESSNIRRFDFIPNGNSVYKKHSTPGPGEYFKERETINRIQKYKKGIKCDKANVKSSIRNFDKGIYPGPGSYDLDKSAMKKNDSRNLCFSSSQKRFQEFSNELNGSPGPADYFFNNDSNLPSNQYQSLRPKLTKMPIIEKRIHNKSQTPNPCLDDAQERKKSLYHSIYNNKQRSSQSIAPFGSILPQQLHHLKSQSTLSPGEYNHAKSVNLIKHHSPEYRFSQTNRGELFPINTLTKYLSQYRKDSYFNWHKKSFNISLL